MSRAVNVECFVAGGVVFRFTTGLVFPQGRQGRGSFSRRMMNCRRYDPEGKLTYCQAKMASVLPEFRPDKSYSRAYNRRFIVFLVQALCLLIMWRNNHFTPQRKTGTPPVPLPIQR